MVRTINYTVYYPHIGAGHAFKFGISEFEWQDRNLKICSQTCLQLKR